MATYFRSTDFDTGYGANRSPAEAAEMANKRILPLLKLLADAQKILHQDYCECERMDAPICIEISKVLGTPFIKGPNQK